MLPAAFRLCFCCCLLLLGARPLLAQQRQARIFYQPGNREGRVPVPAAVWQACQRCCPELAADTTLSWYAYRDGIGVDTSKIYFGTEGEHTHFNNGLNRNISYDVSMQFEENGQPVRYMCETTLDALPWLARRAVRRGRCVLTQRYHKPCALYLLVAVVEPQAKPAAHRTGYFAYFVESTGAIRRYPVIRYCFWRNGRLIKPEPHMNFR